MIDIFIYFSKITRSCVTITFAVFAFYRYSKGLNRRLGQRYRKISFISAINVSVALWFLVMSLQHVATDPTSRNDGYNRFVKLRHLRDWVGI